MLQNGTTISDKFHPIVRQWFAATYGCPTAIQSEAWEAISKGENTLVVAPTGSGKTLAAFLWAIQDLLRVKTDELTCGGKNNAKQNGGVKILYISPLKALGADVEKNLQIPLQAIHALLGAAQDEGSCNQRAELVQVALRTGDTTPDERRKIASHPPDILITTPESLYLMLTSQASTVLKTVQTVIVDEIHSLAPNKRGAHLSLSLERLDTLLEKPAQRIGLSATVNPVEVVARYLGGIHPVAVVKSNQPSDFDLRIQVPVADMAAVPQNGGMVGLASVPHKSSNQASRTKDVWKTDRTLKAAMAAKDKQSASVQVSPDERRGSSSLWPYIESSLLDEITSHRSTIVFVNSRGLCERLTARLNELYAKRQEFSVLMPEGRQQDYDRTDNGLYTPMRSDIGGTTQLATLPLKYDCIAKAHHGSVSKEKRLQVEAELKSGQLRCVVATSSLELGIDMGSVDLVLQVAPPLSVASGLQRIGRANHQVGGRSQARIFPRTRLELLDCVVMSKAMYEGNLEPIALVDNVLDVLAQQTIAAVSQQTYQALDWYEIVRKSACYSNLPEKAYREVLAMVSGYYSRGDLSDFAARIDWNRETDKLSPRSNSQRIAISGGGTIPDRGLYPVVLPEGIGRAGRKRVGELDEEMVYESRVGDVIALGTSSWRIKEISADRVMVEPAPGHIARLPFWHGEQPGRSFELGCEKGAYIRKLTAAMCEEDTCGKGTGSFIEDVDRQLCGFGLDERGQKNLAALLKAQKAATTWVPNDRTLVVERCQDEMGQWRVFLHSPYGKSVHEPWALAVSWRIQTNYGYDPCAMASDDGIVLQIPLTETTLPDSSIFIFDPEEIAHIVRTQVDTTALFAARFRECAMRSLLMNPSSHGKRAPLWQQRIKAGQLLEGARREQNFPLLTESARECLADVYNLKALQWLQTSIASGIVSLRDTTTSVPSPFAAALVFSYVGERIYDPDKPKSAQQASLLSLDTSLLVELLGGTHFVDLIDEEVLSECSCELQRLSGAISKTGPEGIEELLRELGPLSTEEIYVRFSDFERAEVEKWLKVLEEEGRIFSVSLVSTKRWVQPQDIPWLQALTSAELTQGICQRSAYTSAQVQKLLDEELVRFGKTHGPFSIQSFSSRTGIATGVAEARLLQLEAQGLFLKGSFRPESESEWIHKDVFARLRRRSLAIARRAIEPVSIKRYMSHLFALQGVASQELLLGGSDALLEVIARFEGCYMPIALWEDVIFSARVASYKASSLDSLLEAGDVFWQQNESTLAFYPCDSAFCPVPIDTFHVCAQAEEVTVEGDNLPAVERIKTLLVQKGPLTFDELMLALSLDGAYTEKDVVSALSALCSQGMMSNDSFAFMRLQQSDDLADAMSRLASKRQTAPQISRRGRLSVSGSRALKKEARGTVQTRTQHMKALRGHWFLLCTPEATSEEVTLAAVESVLDLYGVITPETVKLAGVEIEWLALSKVLRTMEDTGAVVRGSFVEELGPVQYAQKEFVEALQVLPEQNADVKNLANEERWVVLAAHDPAQCYGALAAWPEPVDSLAQTKSLNYRGGSNGTADEKRMRIQRSKDWLVVFHDAELLLAVMTSFKASYVFSEDKRLVMEAIQRALATIQSHAQRKGESLSRKKIIAKTVNGRDVFETAYGEALVECGFVVLPDGLRFYPQPF